jgi:type IV pilus assembly protein PilV
MNASHGFTLIEILVAVFVMAVGLLGLAALQVAGLRNNQTAYLRTQATHLAHVMSDRMRANLLGVQLGSYNNQAATTDDCDDATDDVGAGKVCTINEMAGYDLKTWTDELAQQLPGGEGTVCLDSTPTDGTADAPACDGNGIAYAIKIFWTEKVPGSTDGEGEDSAGTIARRFVTSFQP